MAKEMAINLLRGSIFTRSLILEAVLESALEVAFESGGASIDPRIVGIFGAYRLSSVLRDSAGFTVYSEAFLSGS